MSEIVVVGVDEIAAIRRAFARRPERPDIRALEDQYDAPAEVDADGHELDFVELLEGGHL